MHNTRLSKRAIVFSMVATVGVLLIGATIFIGCEQQAPVTSAPTPQEEQYAVPSDVLNEIAELRQIASAPDGGLAYWTSGTDAPPVYLPAGSVDGLAAALAAAGNNGTVIVRAGTHTENGMVTIGRKVRIIGEVGAIMEFNTSPDPAAIIVAPALQVLNANHVTIWGLEIRPQGSAGNTAVLLKDARHAVIGNNTFRDQQVGVFVDGADHSTIWGNTIICAATTTAPMGIINCNGKHVSIANNDVTNGLFGIWACDEQGFLLSNNAHGNFIGIILCKVPAGAYSLPGGELVGSDRPGGRWLATGNQATGNGWGYLIIDSANRNTLVNNAASGSGFYDVEFTGDTFRFGFLTPASFNNTFVAGSHPNIVVKNCGNNNTIIGGVLVNNTADPCF